MKRSLAKWLGVSGALIGLSIASGTALADCPGSGVAQDLAVVETPQGSFRVEVCVVHDAAAKQNVYMFTVHNLSFACPFTSFAVRPFADVFVQLQPSPPWQPENEAPHWWIWDGPGAPIEQGKSRQFVLRVPDTVPIKGVSGAVFPHWTSACGAGAREFAALQDQQGPALLCACSPGTPTLRTADTVTVLAGYQAQYLVPPSVLNMPTDVVVRSDGSIVVNSGRSDRIFLVGADGVVSELARAEGSYALGTDAEGNLYSYAYPYGQIVRISGGRVAVVAQVPETFCESPLAVAADGTLYVGHNACEGTSMGTKTLWEISPVTGRRRVILSYPEGAHIMALDVGPDRLLYAVMANTLFRIDTGSGARTLIATLPPGVQASFHGLAANATGFYISTGDSQPEGRLYGVSRSGQMSLVANIPGNGLQGIAVLPNGDIVGAQRCTGGLLKVRPNGEIETIVTPNGSVTPQAITALPCGELVVVNDEAGWASIVCPDGTVRPFVEMISFMPPLTFVAASTQGWIVAGESAPGFAPRLVRYNPDGARVVLAQDLPGVSGVAVAPDGTIFASVTGEGKVVRLSPDGQRSEVANVRNPTGLALSPDGTLYAIVNQQDEGGIEALARGDTVVALTPQGTMRVIARIPSCRSLAVDEAGAIYVAAGAVVKRIDRWGLQSVFASGFQDAVGIAYHGGALYVTDLMANCIVKITRTGG